MRAVAIVVAYDSGPALTRCLDALRDDEVDVVVVNNGGPGPELEDARGREGVTVVEAGGNRGFGAGCNAGAAVTDADVLVFLNPDTVAQPGAVAALARRLEDTGVGVAQARLRLLDHPELLNSSGNKIETYTYDAFGAPTFYNASGTQITSTAYNNRFLFTGRRVAA